MSDISSLKSFFKDERTIFALWMAGLLLAASLVWGLSSGRRSDLLAESANYALEHVKDGRRLYKRVPAERIPAGAASCGEWFLTNDDCLAVVWTLPTGGILTPFLTVFNSGREIDKIVPLSGTAEFFALRAPRAMTELCSRRVLYAAKSISEEY